MLRCASRLARTLVSKSWRLTLTWFILVPNVSPNLLWPIQRLVRRFPHPNQFPEAKLARSGGCVSVGAPEGLPLPGRLDDQVLFIIAEVLLHFLIAFAARKPGLFRLLGTRLICPFDRVLVIQGDNLELRTFDRVKCIVIVFCVVAADRCGAGLFEKPVHRGLLALIHCSQERRPKHGIASCCMTARQRICLRIPETDCGDYRGYNCCAEYCHAVPSFLGSLS
jgi:hypothetical protein